MALFRHRQMPNAPLGHHGHTILQVRPQLNIYRLLVHDFPNPRGFIGSIFQHNLAGIIPLGIKPTSISSSTTIKALTR